MRTVCEQAVSKGSRWQSHAAWRRHQRPGLQISALGVIVAALIPASARSSRPDSRTGTEAEASVLEQPRNERGAGLSRWAPTPPPWAGSSIGTTSPGGAQSRRSSRVEPPNPRPRAPGAVYPSSNSPKPEPSNEKDKNCWRCSRLGGSRGRHRTGAWSCSASTRPPSTRRPP
jgi:hypothetical protein